MTGIFWVCAVPAAHAREEDRWYGNLGVHEFGRLFWLRSNRKAALAEAVQYLDTNDIKYTVLRDQWNRGQYVIATDGDVNPSRPLPEGYWDVDSDYWERFRKMTEVNEHDHCPPVAVHQHDDLAWCITFGDSHGITLGDVADALKDLPRDAEVYSIEVTYFNGGSDDCDGQPVPDDNHTEGVVTIQTEPQLCDEHAAELGAQRVINEAEQITHEHGQ